MAATASDLRLQIKAAIKRAAAQARAQMVRYDQQILDELQTIYRAARNDIERLILSAGDAGGLLRLNVLHSLSAQLNNRINELGALRNQLLNGGMRNAATIGAGVSAAGVSASTLTRLADEAVRIARTFVAEDGLQLSDRLWRLDVGAREGVSRAVQSAIIQGQGASEAVQDFLQRGVDIPAAMREKLQMASATRVSRIAGDVLMTNDGNPYAHAKTVFRTEINRAHGEAFRAAIFEVDGVVGTRFLLSPAHPRTDICDLHAHANRYGLGPGVYPPGRSPWPAHPNTLSFEEPVFADEITAEDRGGQETALDWLGRQNQRTQAAVLGSEAKARALRAGELTHGMIGAPWSVVKKRLEKRGVDISQFIGPAPPSSILPGTTAYASGLPVSRALTAATKKRIMGETLRAIDSVHGDGQLPALTIRQTRSKEFWGCFEVIPLTRRPAGIRIHQQAPWPRLTAAHEIGHFLDHAGIGQPGRFASGHDTELMAGWRQAIEQSASVQQLLDLLNGPNLITHRGVRYRVPKRDLQYLLSPHELWARSYAQYIAVRSRNIDMLAELSRVLELGQAAPIPYPKQWPMQDFARIMQAMDDLFKTLGWRDG